LGIRRKRDIALAESQALTLAQREAVEIFPHDHRFTAADVRKLHQLWLSPIYSWAGEYRSVNIARSGFQFASAWLIPELMGQLEREVLARYTPCRPTSGEMIAEALAVTVNAKIPTSDN
jgi:cell filamentation protein